MKLSQIQKLKTLLLTESSTSTFTKSEVSLHPSMIRTQRFKHTANILDHRDVPKHPADNWRPDSNTTTELSQIMKKSQGPTNYMYYLLTWINVNAIHKLNFVLYMISVHNGTAVSDS